MLRFSLGSSLWLSHQHGSSRTSDDTKSTQQLIMKITIDQSTRSVGMLYFILFYLFILLLLIIFLFKFKFPSSFRLDTTSIQLISCLHYIKLGFLPNGFLPKRLNDKEFLLSEQIKNIYMPPNGLVFSQSPLYQDVSHFKNLMATRNNSFSWNFDFWKYDMASLYVDGA